MPHLWICAIRHIFWYEHDIGIGSFCTELKNIATWHLYRYQSLNSTLFWTPKSCSIKYVVELWVWTNEFFNFNNQVFIGLYKTEKLGQLVPLIATCYYMRQIRVCNLNVASRNKSCFFKRLVWKHYRFNNPSKNLIF